ncbi:hypothetical protein [Sedimenticola sp.]|uniref:hypothetical protein n=1 Tax=Sedimenticola sp. TaxID=1940285 RepID=UPI003D0E8BE7
MLSLELLDVVARWLHLLGILVWIGHNYANVVVNPAYRPASPEAPLEALGKQFEAALHREHGIFRYASLVVLGSGFYMLWHRGILLDVLTLQGGMAVLGIGVWTGIAMALNLWLVLWPHQKKVIGFVPASYAERIRCSRITFLSSRSNTILSFSALFFMIAGSHGVALFT